MRKAALFTVSAVASASARPLTESRVFGFNVNQLASGNFSTDAAFANATAHAQLHAKRQRRDSYWYP